MAAHLGGNFGYVFSVEEANKLIEDLEIQSTAKFATFKATKDFGSVDCTKVSHRIFWEDSQHVDGAKISFNGVPFIILGSKVYDCQHGVDRNTALKRKRREEAETEVNAVKKRRNIQSKQKLNCPAKIKLRDILAFPRFKRNWLQTNFILQLIGVMSVCKCIQITHSSKSNKRIASKMLREALKDGNANPERRIYFEFPSPSDHQNHLVGQEDGMCQRVDKRIINRIHELVAEGLTNTKQVKHQLEFFVKNVLFKDKELPQHTNRRFYPTANDIHSHILRGKLKNRYSSQEASMPLDQPLSANEIVNTSLDELPIEVVSNDMNVLPDDANVLPNDTNDDINEALSSVDAGEKCRDLLEQLRQLTFVTQDEEVLANLNNRLQELLRDMQLVCHVRQVGDHDYVGHGSNSSLHQEN